MIDKTTKTLDNADFDAGDLLAIITKKLLKTDGTFYLFNVAKNPSENEDGNCLNPEECTNLFGNDAFLAVQIAMLDKWKEYRDGMDPSEFTCKCPSLIILYASLTL